MRISKTDNIELVTIYEVSKILSSSLDLHKTMRSVLNVLSSHLHMQRGMVALLQDDAFLQVIAATGLDQEEIANGRYKPGEGVMGGIKTAFTRICRLFAVEAEHAYSVASGLDGYTNKSDYIIALALARSGAV